MSTTPLTDAINALTTYSNETTGESDTTLSAAVASLVAGYGGGSLGGLANMATVNDQDYHFAFMLSQLKNGNSAGGTVSWSTAFANSEQKLLSTGLTTLHGFLFVSTTDSITVGGSGAQSGKFLIITVNSDSTFNAQGSQSQNVLGGISTTLGATQGTEYASSPIHGTLRFDGGDIYYTARYNGNSSYQILCVNTTYDWLAW